MNDFLSNIDIGVFDLDDVLKHGIGSMVPDRFRNQVKQSERKYKRLVKETNNLIDLHRTAVGKEKRAIEKRLTKLRKDRIEAVKDTRQKAIERQIRGNTLTGTFQNFATTNAGRGALLATGAILRDIQKTFSNIQSEVNETGFFSSRLLRDFDKLAGKSKEIVVNGERLYNTSIKNFETFVDIRREFGATEEYSLKTLDNITQLENIIGLSSEEAIELLSTFKGINQETIQVNTSMIQTFSALASKNGVAFRDVMQDITDNADFFATYMAKSSEKMGELIVKSRRMGLSFSTFANALGQFTEIESTIEKQMRLSIFAGQQMDLMSIMENVYAGNIQQAGQQLLSQVGGVDSGLLNNPLVKQQFMEALGMEATQFNKLIKTAKEGPTFQDRIDRDLSNSLEEFNENFKQLGFGTLKKDFTQFIINPLSNMFQANREAIQDLIGDIGVIIKYIGMATTFLGKGILSIREFTNSSVATLSVIAGAVAGISALAGKISAQFGVQGAQLTQLQQINTNTAMMAGVNPTGGIGGTTMSGKFKRMMVNARNAPIGKTVGYGVGGAVAGGLATGLSTDSVGAGIANAIITGLGTAGGFMLGGPAGALIGGTLAGSLGDIGIKAYMNSGKNDAVKQARGGIFNKRYTGMMDVAEAGKPEAFTPLDVEDGKPTLPTKLADDSIKKLSEAMSKMRFIGEVKMPDGSKKSIEFYNHVMKPSSALNT